MAVLSNDLIRQGSSGVSGEYTIKNSIRFNPGDNTYMHRTQDTADNKRKLTFSWWMKRGYSFGSELCIISAGASSRFMVRFNTSNQLTFRLTNSTTEKTMTTAMLFRDPSAWYHCVWVANCTNDLPDEFSILYVNGVRVPMTGTQPSADTDFAGYGDGSTMGISTLGHSLSTQEWDGYLAELHLLDGYAYGPEYFGKFSSHLIWVPIEYTGSYGTNGFYIKGSDSSSLGTDSSGNGNNFTTNGLATNDQRIDTPTNNQITFNPLNNQRSGGTPSNGNLNYTGPSTRTNISLTANIPTTGKWAIAFKATDNSNDEWNMGITKATNSNFGDAAGSNEAIGGQDNDGIQFLPTSNDAQLYDYLASATIDPSLPITTSDEFWMAVDTATGKCFLGIYDASDTSMKFVAADTGLDGNPATGDNPTITISDMIGSGDYTFAVNSKNTNVWTLLRSTEVSGTTPSGYTYFENVKDLL